MHKQTIVTVLLALALATTALAQEKKERQVTLYGQVFDSFTRTYLDSVVVTVVNADGPLLTIPEQSSPTRSLSPKGKELASDTAYTYREGTRVWGQQYHITVPAIPALLTIRAEAPGYEPDSISYALKRIGRNNSFHVPAIYLKRTARSAMMETDMDEITVRASKVQLVWRGDTMVYDATAFNLSEGSMLDDLIRQLPGVELKEDGEILVNGKKVDYLTLNGKDFFKGNNKMMLDNLPYFAVKNVRAFHRSTDESEYLGRDVQRKDFVMDVQLKREYAEGYIANAELAGGTHERWLARAFGLRYTDNTRLTLFGNANNLNENRHPGSDGDWTPSDQPMGMRTYKTLNANYRYERQGRWHDEASASVAWNNTSNETRNTSTTYMQTGNVSGSSRLAFLSKQFRADVSNRFQLKEPFYLSMNTSFSTQPYRRWSDGSSMRLTNDTLTNRTVSEDYSDQRSWTVSHNMTVTTKLAWGDHVNIYLNGNYNKTSNDGFARYTHDYFRPAPYSDHRNEYRPADSRSHSWNATFYYAFTLGKGWMLVAAYDHEQGYSSNSNPLYRLDRDSVFSALAPSLGELPLLKAALQDSLNSQWTSKWTSKDNGGLTLQYTKSKENVSYVYFQASFPVNNVHERERYTRSPIDTTVTQTNVLFDPSVWFQYYDLKRNTNWSFNYSHSTSTPGITDLIGYRDESNPLNVRLGNPDLHNSSRHRISARYTHSVPRRDQTLNLATNYDVTIAQIMQTYSYDSQTGAYTYRPKNVDGNWWWEGNVSFITALDSAKHWQLTNNVRCFRHNVAYAVNGEETTTRRVNVRERFGLRYKLSERFDIQPTAQAEWERAWSPMESYQTTDIWEISYGANLHWRLPWDIQLTTDLRQYHRRGFEDESLDTNHLIWNAQLSRSFCKGALIAKLTGYDLLGQISHTSWSVGSDGISSTWQRGIPQYVMAHLAWKFTRKPKGK